MKTVVPAHLSPHCTGVECCVWCLPSLSVNWTLFQQAICQCEAFTPPGRTGQQKPGKQQRFPAILDMQ